MSGFDQGEIFVSDPFGSEDQSDERDLNRVSAKKRFKEFLREFHEGTFAFPYRDQLKQHYNLGQYYLEVDLEDLSSFDENLADKLRKNPSEYLPLFETAAKEVADEVTRPRPIEEEEVQDVQITLRSGANPFQIRELRSEHMAALVKIPGIIISASSIRSKATNITIQCRSCQNTISNIPLKPGLEGYAMPRKCPTDQTGRPPCPLDPFFIMPDKCKCVDFQVLKLQESPDAVPNGEMPRHMQLYCDRYLTERVVPGNRVTVIGIYSIKKVAQKANKERDAIGVGIRKPYLRVVGIYVDTEGPGRSTGAPMNPADEEEFRRLATRPDVADVIARSIAPSIYGSVDIKKCIACLLFGGSRKRLPDGLTRRGDINVLLLGDPGTAKSQLLKFVEKVSPIGVYTSGKGSSAAGLTASVMRDPVSRNFVMEGGAMVLADGGVVCIDEFDKMREDDRVAIHEAMEQQTISIAKAGITTTLNSRCAVLAAANSVFGRWDDTKGDQNIDFMPTILSRFDTIFIVKDEHNQAKDIHLAKHVMQVHLNAAQTTQANEGELSLSFLKKYISYCKSKCGPRLSESAAEKLKNRYVLMRSGAKEHERDTEKKISIPITVRQLEAIIRISESLAKMSLSPFATETHVDEALRLFQVSTLDAAMSGSLAGASDFTPEHDMQEIRQIEKQLKRRFAIGTQVSEQRIIADFLKQNYSERAVQTVLYMMIRRGEVEHRLQRKVLYRVR
ncbi:DNA replication licensing factor mcm5-A [Nematostella vectensis]|uniref:DNA replication licensing factor mcm5-A n=1 Tax=Nematostella vectensis TaxID=45351 RepID=UPI0020775593|nr:DNA replication licensing factor mcm5-A [Nematostella vectensis]